MNWPVENFGTGSFFFFAILTGYYWLSIDCELRVKQMLDISHPSLPLCLNRSVAELVSFGQCHFQHKMLNCSPFF